MGGSECLVARDAAGGVGCGEEGGHPMTDYEANLTAAQFKITGVKSKGGRAYELQVISPHWRRSPG